MTYAFFSLRRARVPQGVFEFFLIASLKRWIEMSPPPYQKRNTKAQAMPSLNLDLPDKPNAAIETPLSTASATVEFAVYVVDVFT